MNSSPELYPLIFEEVIQDYEFGDRNIPRMFPEKDLPGQGIIAETWEVSAHPDFPGRVKNGVLAGKTLPELIDSYGTGLLGKDVADTCGGVFPLLLKFLDARETLEVQVHPDDEYAKSRGLDRMGKPEAWYILNAEPEASLYWGTREGVTEEQLRRVGPNEDKFRDYLMDIPVTSGDVIYLPPGTVHAIGKGIVLFEIQQTSDVTIGPDYLFCSGGKVDEVGPEESFEMFMDQLSVREISRDEVKIPPLSFSEGGNRFSYLLATPFFVLRKVNLKNELVLPASREDGSSRFSILTCLSGQLNVESEYSEVLLSPGVTGLMPAGLERVNLRPVQGEVEVLESYVPNIRKDVYKPLMEHGFSEDEVVALGGPGEKNGLAEYLE